uniref:Reverse transcriptase domain-containing protein n=1 Tax=Tanacetum cinerariifolium TaxID=118510 RepID=A0A6L2JJN6_TANCI|nr:hypothetical protein [Tanacetum cinerariifolium]
MKNEVERKADDEPAKSAWENVTKNKEDEPVGVSSSHALGYYLKHRINKKIIEGLVENQRFNDSLSATRVGKMKRKTYDLLSRGPMHDAILKKKITRKEDIGGNFEIPCNVGGLKNMNAIVDQGFNVNVMPLSIYNKLNDERPAETDIMLSLASHLYIYPLGIAEVVLVDVVGYVYPMDFMILDIKEDRKRPFILGTPFLTTAKAVIKFDKGMITLRYAKSKINFHRIPEPHCRIKKGIKNDIKPIAPTMTINRGGNSCRVRVGGFVLTVTLYPSLLHYLSRVSTFSLASVFAERSRGCLPIIIEVHAFIVEVQQMDSHFRF